MTTTNLLLQALCCFLMLQPVCSFIPHACTSIPNTAGRRTKATTTVAMVQTMDEAMALQKACQSDGVLLDLSSGGWGLLSITGEDRLRFLHNQLTQSFTDAKAGQVLQSSYTSSLGRAIDLVSTFVLEEEVLLVASPNRHEQLLAAFNKYIFPLDRVKVKKKEMRGLFTLLGSAAATSSIVSQLLGDDEGVTLPDPGQCCLTSSSVLIAEGTGLAFPGLTILHLGGGGSNTPSVVAAAAAKVPSIRVGGPAEWEALRILQGRPHPDKELTLDVTPLEAGLWHMVGFEKGCYLGQETLAKQANNKGERQRLYGVKAVPGGRGGGLEEGKRIVDGEGRRAGVVTSCLHGEVGLAYIRKTVTDPLTAGSLFLEADNDDAKLVSVQVVDIPFASRTVASTVLSSTSGSNGSNKKVPAVEDAAAAAEKLAEAERKAAKLEEMKKRLEAFQQQKKQQASG